MRRVVRVTEEFFAQLDAQFGSDRGSRGEPSATDFLVLDLPPIVERFATGFDKLPEGVEGIAVVRVLIVAGILVRGIAVYGLLVEDDTIELIGVELDTT